MGTFRFALAIVLLAGIGGLQSNAEQFVLNVELEVVSVDLEHQQITLLDLESNTPYVCKVDKKTKLKAKKKCFAGSCDWKT